jgi:hypothetical protein
MGPTLPVAVVAPRKGSLPRPVIRMIGFCAVPQNWRVIITLTLHVVVKSHIFLGFLITLVARP